jgi:hypothetical protein
MIICLDSAITPQVGCFLIIYHNQIIPESSSMPILPRLIAYILLPILNSYLKINDNKMHLAIDIMLMGIYTI